MLTHSPVIPSPAPAARSLELQLHYSQTAALAHVSTRLAMCASLPGELWSLLHEHGCLPETWCQLIISELALALEHVHLCLVLYRDIKPENVMIGKDGHVQLIDFGFSKQLAVSVLDASYQSVGLSSAGIIINYRCYNYNSRRSFFCRYGNAAQWLQPECCTFVKTHIRRTKSTSCFAAGHD